MFDPVLVVLSVLLLVAYHIRWYRGWFADFGDGSGVIQVQTTRGAMNLIRESWVRKYLVSESEKTRPDDNYAPKPCH